MDKKEINDAFVDEVDEMRVPHVSDFFIIRERQEAAKKAEEKKGE